MSEQQQTQNERLNSKYEGRFIVTRFDYLALKSVQVGLPHKTIEQALEFCRRRNRNLGFYMVDVLAMYGRRG